MIRNYLVITFRNFARNRSYTLINVLGLSIGVTCCIILFLMIRFDLSFDKFHSKKDSIYLVGKDSENASGVSKGASTPYPFAAAFRNDFPGIPVTQYHNQHEMLMAIGEDKHMVDGVIFADSMFFNVFDFKVLSGSPEKELGQPGKIFVTKSFADKYLKDNSADHIKLGNIVDTEIVGIIADPPATSDIQFSVIVSMPTLSEEILGFKLTHWGLSASARSYVVLPSDVSKDDVETQLKAFVDKYHGKDRSDKKQTYHLLPITEFHFNTDYNPNAASTSDLVMLGVLALFIMSIACINFVNLSTALAVKKSKEIGVRKTLGAKRSQLAWYFLGETFIITVMAMLISLGTVELALPWLKGFLEKNLTESIFLDATLLIFVILLIVVVTILSGLYPAMVLSGYNPVAVLKNKITGTTKGAVPVRKVLVTFQFFIAQALIIGTIIVANQMRFIRNSPLGFSKDALLNVPMPDNKPEVREALKARLMANPDIKNISFSVGAPVSDNEFETGFYLSDKGASENYDVALKIADANYLETYDLELVAGRGFTEADEKLASPPIEDKDRKYVYIINETAAKKLGFTNPNDVIDKHVTSGLNDIEAPIIGVVKDFHVKSLHSSIAPVILVHYPHFYVDAGIRVNTTNLRETISFIEKTWSEVHPEYYFEYKFLDEHLAGMYRQEERTFTLFMIFSGISIFIGCLGLYGLISFMANQKLKEVGIRKVMGASVNNIIMLFSKEFVRLITVAFIIAAPLSWFVMNEWLADFAYRIDVQWWVFAIGLASTMIIAVATVSYRSYRAATSNPVETLRSE